MDFLQATRKRENQMDYVHVAGLGIDDKKIPSHLYYLVKKADLIVGGIRCLEKVPDNVRGKRLCLKGSIEKVIKRVLSEVEKGKFIVVLADGDPLFYGIGKRLIEFLGEKRIKFYPAPTTLQIAASRLKISWEDVKVISLHGRGDIWPLFRAVTFNDLIGIYTDARFNPLALTKILLERGVNNFRMIIFEDLGLETERITSYDNIAEIPGDINISPLNFVLLQKIKSSPLHFYPGMDDRCYKHENGVITKKEIRLISIGQLKLNEDNTLWDLGAGCGSVAIEASFFLRYGKVYAVEKNKKRFEMMLHNIRQTGAYLVEPVHGVMPECLQNLPDPDRIFIGGGVGKTIDVLKSACERLLPGGILVVNAVLLGTLERVRKYFESLGWEYDISEINVARSKELGEDLRFEPLTPVFVLNCKKPG